MLAALAVAVAIFLKPTGVQAFRCAQALDDAGAATGPGLAWSTRSVPFVLQQSGTAQIPFAQVHNAVLAAAATWQSVTLQPQLVCSDVNGTTDLRFIEQPTTSASWVGYDFIDPNRNFNLLVFRDDAVLAGLVGDPTAADTLALTTVTYSTLTGQIIDADIEFNSGAISFATTPTGEQIDLQSAIVHELGHFLGLAHCTSDANGSCGHNEVMEPVLAPGDTSRRALACDDAAGLLFRYPQGQAVGTAPAGASSTLATCRGPDAPSATPTLTFRRASQNRGCMATHNGISLAVAVGLFAFVVARKRAKNMFMLFVLLALLPQCQRATRCNGSALPRSSDAPRILAAHLLGPINIDPWRVVVGLDVYDAHANLAGGNLKLYVDDSQVPVQSLPVASLLSSSGGLDGNQAFIAGLQTLVRFERTTRSNTTLKLGLELEDESGLASNCYEMDIGFVLNP